MKLSFSTIACPEWDFYREIFSAAKDLGYNGIEIRGIGKDLYAPTMALFSDEQIEATKKSFRDANIEISCLASGACLGAYGEEEKALAEGKDYIDLAHKLGVKFVRVMPTGNPQIDECDINQAKRVYKELAKYGQGKGVTPIMETNGIFSDTAVLKNFLEDTKEDNIGALWDINHPVRYNKETAAQTISNIGKYIKYVHIKDSVEENGQTVYKLVGKGDLPIKEVVSGLQKIGYNGYLTLEWVRRWNKNLEEPGWVLPYYISYMHTIL